VYRLKTPNKLTIDQVVWGPDDKLILHNFNWQSEKSPDIEPVVPIQTSLKVRPVVIKAKEEPKAPAAVENEMPELSNPVPVVEEEPKPKTKVNTQNIVMFYCQPVEIKESQDDLYGDKVRKIERGKKFTFEGIIIENIDIAMTFWTNVDIKKNSVVFVAKYRSGRKYGEYRWWKIVDSQPKANGTIYKTIPSDYTPEFAT